MDDTEGLVTLTADIVSAFVSNNSVAVGDMAQTISTIHSALASLNDDDAAPARPVTPAVSVRASVKPDALTCLECGKTYKTIKRHIGNEHGLTPAQYRDRFKLRSDYPMVAPNYSEVRRAAAKKIGLGKKGRGNG